MAADDTQKMDAVFDGKPIPVVVDSTSYNKAKKNLFDGNTGSKSDRVECIAISKLEQCGIACAKADGAEADLAADLGAGPEQLDLKTLFVPGWLADAGVDVMEHLEEQVDHALNKEDRQQTTCLFDLSFIPDDLRPQVVALIANKNADRGNEGGGALAHHLIYDRQGGRVLLDGRRIP